MNDALGYAHAMGCTAVDSCGRDATDSVVPADWQAPFAFNGEIKSVTLDVTGDLALPVTDDYPKGESNQFSGRINWVRIDLEEDDVSQLEPDELKYHRTLARQ